MTGQPQLSVVESGTDKPAVHEAWLSVMTAVQSVGKTVRNTQQNYSFRGVDAVVNAVGPALREHGVFIRPKRIVDRTEDKYETKNGASMRNVTLTIEWEVCGPAGDSFTGESVGEAADSGDKAVSKAHSVAYRTYLIQALALPTDDPDPDSSSHERSTAGQPDTEWMAFESSEKWLTLITAAGTVAQLDEVVAQSKPYSFTDPDKALLGAAVVQRRRELDGSQP